MINGLRRSGTAATLAVALGAFTSTAPATAQARSTGAVGQVPPAPTTCIPTQGPGSFVIRTYESVELGRACRDCLADASVDNANFDGMHERLDWGPVWDCQETLGGTSANLTWSLRSRTSEPEPAPAPVPDPAPAPDPLVPAPPETCVGYVHNTQWSDYPIDAVTESGAHHALDRGQAWPGTDDDRVVGFQVPYGGLHIQVEYIDIVGNETLRTDDFDLTAPTPTPYALDRCHEAHIVATRSPSA